MKLHVCLLLTEFSDIAVKLQKLNTHLHSISVIKCLTACENGHRLCFAHVAKYDREGLGIIISQRGTGNRSLVLKKLQ